MITDYVLFSSTGIRIIDLFIMKKELNVSTKENTHFKNNT